MDKSNRKIIFLIIALIFCVVSLLFQFVFQNRPFSGNFVAIIPFVIAMLPFISESIEASMEARKKRNSVENTYDEIKNYLQPFFKWTFNNPPIPEESISKEEIYETFLKCNFKEIDNIKIKSILLCFYCDMWKKTRSPYLYGEMQKYSYSIGLPFAELTSDTKIFLNIYSSFQKRRTKFNYISDITSFEKSKAEYLNLLLEFAEIYLKDLLFFEIKDKLIQSENLRSTLIKIIKDGKLSKWGISNETLKQLEKDLKKQMNYSKTFLVIGTKIGETTKEYLKRQSGFTGWVPNTRNIPFKGKFSGYIVKPKDNYNNAEDFLNKLKTMSDDEFEKIIFVIPLDFLNSKGYVFPDNQSFKSKNLKDCYEAISWFKTGLEYSDTDLWNAISTSSVTLEELLAIIPFNIFCEGILPCEQEFMIKNYTYIKEKCGINKLTDWKNVNSNLITDYLLESGSPNYNKSEKKHVLKLESDDEFETKTKKRMLDLCEQIIENSTEFDESLSFIIK